MGQIWTSTLSNDVYEAWSWEVITSASKYLYSKVAWTRRLNIFESYKVFENVIALRNVTNIILNKTCFSCVEIVKIYLDNQYLVFLNSIFSSFADDQDSREYDFNA